jgi:exosome complex RNA-binding protein Csl4
MSGIVKQTCPRCKRELFMESRRFVCARCKANEKRTGVKIL